MPLTKLSLDAFSENLRLSEVKRKLLKELWGSNAEFPKPWIKSSILLKLTNQKYFDRRLRELRDSEGLDIESKFIDGEHCWRLNSSSIAQTTNRTYLTAAQKTSLFNLAKNKCAVCGKIAESGVRGLQADHKIPLFKGGGSELGNWQPLCNECNVAKRGMCKNCTLDCVECAWAYPEKTGFNFVIKMPAELKQDLVDKKTSLSELEAFLIEQIRNHIR